MTPYTTRILLMAAFGLHFCFMNLYMAVLVAGRGVLQGGLNAALFYMLLTPPAGLALSLLLRKKSASAFPASLLALPLLVSSFLPLAWGVSAGETAITSALGLTPLFFSILLCWPVGFFLFFRTVQPARWGLLFGLAMASRELAWIVVLPLLSIVISLPLTPEHIQPMCMMLGVIQAGSCLCFALALLWTPHEDAPRIFRADAAIAPEGKTPLLLLFAAGVLFFGQIGMEFQATFPRSTFQPELSSWIHVPLLAGVPLAGWLMDGGSRGPEAAAAGLRVVAVTAVCIAFAVPVLLLVYTDGGYSGRLFSLMSVARDCVFLMLFITAGRIAWKSPWLPLLGCLAYSLYTVQSAGNFAGRKLGSLPVSPTALTVIELGAALAFAALLALAVRRLEKAPDLLYVPHADMSPGENAPDYAAAFGKKFAAFAVAFGLTRRETQVLECLIRKGQPAHVSRELGISESTVRYHQTGLFKKTGQSNRRLLALFFQTWKPE